MKNNESLTETTIFYRALFSHYVICSNRHIELHNLPVFSFAADKISRMTTGLRLSPVRKLHH